MKRWLALLLLLLVASCSRRVDPSAFEIHAVADKSSPTTQAFTLEDQEAGGPKQVFLEREVLLDGTAVRSARVGLPDNSRGWYDIEIRLNDAGGKRFAEVTKKLLNQRLGIVLNGQLVTAPVVRSIIYGGSLQITGKYTEPEATKLVNQLNASQPGASR